jgi:ABC-type uncharacterized transport system permease subunit
MWPIAAAGLVLLLAGASAYAGFGKPIVVTMWPKPYLSFGLAWLGLAGLLVALGTTLIDAGQDALGVVLSLLALGCFVITLLSFFRLPRTLLPGWYRRWLDGGRSPGQVSRWPKFGRGGSS